MRRQLFIASFENKEIQVVVWINKLKEKGDRHLWDKEGRVTKRGLYNFFHLPKKINDKLSQIRIHNNLWLWSAPRYVGVSTALGTAEPLVGLARLECQIRVKEQRSTKTWKGKTEDGAHKLSHSVHDMFHGLRNIPAKEIPERYSQFCCIILCCMLYWWFIVHISRVAL